MNAITVCVNYGDILGLTLPYNRLHFQRVVVVTSFMDHLTTYIANDNNCSVYRTDAFYRDGAIFNKWLALEEGLNFLGREGWLTILDCDIVLPKDCILPFFRKEGDTGLRTPKRRIYEGIPDSIPNESKWEEYHLYKEKEFAGYCQIFHCNDPVLKEMPWFATDWIHAGGADSYFQNRWKPEDKIRPSFEVLHIGDPPGTNWCGRGNKEKLQEILKERRRTKSFDHEKIGGNP